MKNNYNDIIDIILTFIHEDISNDIVIGGSLVPYLMLGREPKFTIDDFYMLISEDKINRIREKLEKLREIYDFEIISDSKKLTRMDYGFKIKYENVVVGLFPFNDKDNQFMIKTYSYNEKKRLINLKTKCIPNLSRKKVIKKVIINESDEIMALIPEFTYVEEELSGNLIENKGLFEILNNVCDIEVTLHIRNCIEKSKTNIIKRKSVEGQMLTIISLSFALLTLILMLLVYLFFER